MHYPRYVGSVAGAAPLRMQLGTLSTSVARVVGITACGESAAGAASRPFLVRPLTPGLGLSASVGKLSPGSSDPVSTLINTFSSAPSTPSVPSLSFNLPVRVVWTAPTDQGVLVGGQGVADYVLLYANAADEHTWTGSLTWEEL